jgi:hypothetical protein
MARMVLRPGKVLWLGLVLSLMSACVLPLAPDFQDPPASANYAPFFFNVEPPIGSVVQTNSFLVTVSDPNVGDDLTVRWIADFPPHTDNTRVLLTHLVSHSADGTPLVHDDMVMPDCVIDSLAKIQRHQIMVVVADRGFLPPQVPGSKEIDVARIPDVGRKVVATWTLEMECK